MDKQQIIDYIMHTPSNTNPAMLGQFLDEYSRGSGSSGDLSTAEVTIINNSSTDFFELGDGICIGAEIDNIYTPNRITSLPNFYYREFPMTMEIILYKNSARLLCTNEEPPQFSVVGNATYNDNGEITITGDCTITFTDADTPQD